MSGILWAPALRKHFRNGTECTPHEISTDLKIDVLHNALQLGYGAYT